MYSSPIVATGTRGERGAVVAAGRPADQRSVVRAAGTPRSSGGLELEFEIGCSCWWRRAIEPFVYASVSTVRPSGSGRWTTTVRYRTGTAGLAMDLNTGRWFATVDGERVVVFEIGEHGLSEPRILGRHEGDDHRVAFDPDGRLVATASSDGQIKIWDPTRRHP